jgi:hypothetical protein
MAAPDCAHRRYGEKEKKKKIRKNRVYVKTPQMIFFL